MEDPTKLDSSGNENKTEIKANTTADTKAGEFVAGTVLASRYRIIGLVGKGGMGEVYKAEDIKLSQIVALKFLPDSYQNDSAALERFHSEVRHARQVSHVNVCRVFDIGEIDGRHFLSMEFVDGDDLSALLTRVGRFTSERAVEIARQLCVGMEAIHNTGILHRDLKPGNIIIDSRGVARITDFGIAGIESEMKGDNIRAGTPAYMSPEQITGKEVTVRSDIYALGLVIYEIFTGKQAFIADNVMELIKMHQTATPTNPSEIVKGIDPLVESVIAQCLEKDPKDRPQTALHVAMALPGGNPLQIALDAGQTPSPEMVAASPKKGALRPVVALSLVTLVLFSIGLTMAVSKRSYLHRMVPLDKSAEVLREHGRSLTEKLGYPNVDSYSGFLTDDGYIKYLRENDQTPQRWQRFAVGQPSVIQFWYRSSPAPLAPVSDRYVTLFDPQNTVPGMAELALDTKGRLVWFSGNPPAVDESGTVANEFDWAGLFKEAGFDIAAFQPVDSQWVPGSAFDDRRAFSGSYPESSDIAIRIEAAAYRGKLVDFLIIKPWTKTPEQASSDSNAPLYFFFMLAIYFGVLFLSAWLAVRNVRAGRSDIRGAIQISTFMFAIRMLTWAFSTHHIASSGELELFVSGLQAAFYWSAMAGFMYLAFEPYLRKSAPERMISWNRLLAGDWRDPLVGRDVLIGLAAAAAMCVLWVLLNYFLPIAQGKPASLMTIGAHGPGASILAGFSDFPALITDEISAALIATFMVSFLILFLGLFLRRKSFGMFAVCLIITAVGIASGISQNLTLNEMFTYTLVLNVIALVAGRFGVLAFMAAYLFMEIFNRPVTTDLSAWYAGEFIAYALILLGLAVFGFYTSTAGQKLWQGNLLGDGD